MRWIVFISDRLRRPVGVLVVLLLLNAPARAASLLEKMDSEVSALYEHAKDAVVKVHAELPSSLARATLGPSHRVSSGFFIDASGRLVTTGVLVDGAEICWIEWRGRKIEAKLLGRDPLTNLAVLQVKLPEPTPHLSFANSDDLRVGSMVVAVGFPYDLSSAPVVGFVSGYDISCGKHLFPVSYVRASCRVQPGQGGGALLNARGGVVGLVVAAHGENECYSIPGNAAKKVIGDIIEHGSAQHAWVGLAVAERQSSSAVGLPAHWQVYVKEVLPTTPAAQAGFQERDVVIRISTNQIRRAADVLNAMFYRRHGESVALTFVRESVTQEVSVVVGRRPATGLPAQSLLPASGALPAIVPAAESR